MLTLASSTSQSNALRPRILVTGAGGYIGSMLVRTLLSEGYRVLGVDRMYFGEHPLAALQQDANFSLLRADVCRFEAHHLAGIHAVVDLAALSNDPSAELDPRWTDRVNNLARVRLANLARAAGVSRYVLVSSCSVYGRASQDEVDEKSPVDPITEYARAGVRAEQGVLPLAHDDNFCATVLRLGTVYGLSYRMRFDLVVNTMTMAAHRHRCLTLHGGGTQWRPLVHVRDVAGAILATLRAPVERVRGEIFNVGQTNLQIAQVAQAVRDVLGDSITVRSDGNSPDQRNYRVSFHKAAEQLGFKTAWGVGEAIDELHHALIRGEVSDTLETYTVQWYKKMLMPVEGAAGQHMMVG